MVFRLFVENFTRSSAYRTAFGLTGLSFLFYYLGLPWLLFICLGLGLLCLLAGIFFPIAFDEIYRTSQSILLGSLSFFVSLLILIGYVFFWKPILFLLGKREEQN
ncbi:hypothetical protein LEP1GSC050_1069 [Leptospira broomii serovar Hurstbridge str. 5399]|uniref:Uncharacterized protein n=1 Tax=Leptospira broomii serovar Hurstbridge str. 5399 TaxID=1049789 RepID=T0F718_9LEPT|nr:hypothetical protein [Leptospira broomii]EQA46930.1 hypothetical protein LEP1GSC050_1069 [Leptospira broomii serovar Hurstbridge str. 5399]